MRLHTPSHPSLLALALSVTVVGCSDQGLNSKDGGDGSGTTGTTDVGEGEGEGEDDNYEDGCILVDGAGGYRWINDAIEVAGPGSVIELCATQGDEVHEEVVVVDKAVNIVGPGRDHFRLAPPVNENGLVIAASGASVSGMTIETTRSGVVVGDAAGTELSGITLEDIKVYDAPNWGISVEGATDVTISNVELGANVYGGISVDEASVLVDGSIIQGNFAYGLFVTNGSEVTIARTEVIGTEVTDPDVYADGHGVYATEGSLIATEDSAFIGNDFVNVFADQADLDLSGDDIVGALYGVVELDGDASLDGVTITDGAFHAAFLITTGSVSLSNMAVSGDPAVVAAVAPTEWNVTDEDGNTPIAGAGLVIQAPDVSISDSTIVGYNNAGLVLLTADTGSTAMARVTLSDNGQHGIYMGGHQLTMEDVEISGVFELEEVASDVACTTVDTYGGAVFVGGTVVWRGGVVADNLGYGVSGIRAAMDIAGVEVQANKCAGIINFDGDLVAENNTFSQSVPYDIDNSALAANVVLYLGGTNRIAGNTFSDNQRPYDRQSSEYDAGTYTYYYVYHEHSGLDMYVYDTGPTEISGNTFTDGVQSVVTYDTEVEVSNNTWTNYYGTALSVSGEIDADVSDNEFTDVGGYAVSCSNGNLSMEDNVVAGGGMYSYTYDYYVDDELVSEIESDPLYSAVYLYTCSLSMEGDEITERASNALYSYNGDSSGTQTIELIDVVIDQINDNKNEYSYYGGIFAYAFYGVTDIYMEGVEITNVATNHAVELYNANLDGTGKVTMVDSVIDTVGENGIYLYGKGAEAELQSTTISNTTESGIYAYYDALVTLSDAAIISSGESNINLQVGGTLVVDSAAPSSATLSSEWGLYCGADAEVTNCADLDLSSNDNGRHDGCEAFCDAD